ncbi:MAG: hypothetical protein ACMG6S_02465 [Byssovorax sp.]
MSNSKKIPKPQAAETSKASPPPAAKPFPAGADPLTVAPAAVASAAAALAAFVPVPATYDAVLARSLVETYRSRLAAIDPQRIITPRLDVDAAARALLSVHATVTQAPGLHGQLEQLHAAKQLDIASVDSLKDVVFIVMYAQREATEAGAFKSTAKIPEALDKASATLEAEMQSVCEHNLGDHPAHSLVLDALRPGTAYLDRANDLLGYAKLYEAEPATVSKDTKYKPTHLADARKLAGEIIAALSAAMTPKAREWYDLLQRAWTLATKMYFEVQAAGTFLLRYDPRRDERFPSLYAVGRVGVGRKKGKKAAGAGDSNGAPADVEGAPTGM